jgi:hypothetical protein
MIKGALAIGDRQNKMLYELMPQVFPEERLTEVEIILWGKHLEKINKMNN